MAQTNLSKVDSIGSSKNDFEEVENVIEVILGNFIERIHINLKQADAIVSGKIADIQIEKTSESVSVIANSWLLYQDKGINGSETKLYDTPYSFKDKRPPLEPFKQWIKARNIQLRDNAKYHGKESGFKHLNEEDKINSAAYAIRESVFKKGIKPKNVYSKEIPKLVEDLQNEIADFCVNQILENIRVENK